MTGPTPPGRPADGLATADSAPRRKSALLAPLAALGVAAAAIAGAYATSNRSTTAPSPTAIAGVSATQAVTAPALQRAFPAEPGPEGVEGQWVGDVASATLSGLKQNWVAFRALSLRRGRTLIITPARGHRGAIRIGVGPAG